MKNYTKIIFTVILSTLLIVSSGCTHFKTVEETSIEETPIETTIDEEVNVDEDVIDEEIVGEEVVEEDNVVDTEEDVLEKDNEVEYLLQINNPDYTYSPYPIILSDYDREQLAHLVMGEFSVGGFVGCALIAQSVRDAMVKFGYTSIDEVILKMQYDGWYSGKPSDFAYEAIDFIFTEGNAAVQHRILVMYASNIIYSSWHEAQEFVVQYQTVRFFDY